MKVFLDDLREAPGEDWITFRNFGACVLYLLGKYADNPKLDLELSLDHDLGEAKTGYDLACLIEKWVVVHGIKAPRITVHSANPVGRQNIERCIQSIQRYVNSQAVK